MNTEVRLAFKSERDIVANLMQMYLHDLSEFDHDNVSANGRYEYRYFNDYWVEEERHPFLIFYDSGLAGFALVREFAPETWSMAEFFVLRKFRKRGVGAEAARLLFEKFKGTWHVAQEEENLPAQKFWRKTIANWTDGTFTEEMSEQNPIGPKQVFVSS